MESRERGPQRFGQIRYRYRNQEYQEKVLSNPVVRKPVRLVRSGEAFDLQPVEDYQRSSIYSNDLIEFPVGTSGT